MTKKEREDYATEKARELMIDNDYDLIIKAINETLPVLFRYTDRYGVYAQYRALHPVGFFVIPETDDRPEEIFLWGEHRLHDKKEQYFVDKISDVKIIGDLVSAVVDPPGEALFWDGSSDKKETTIL